MPNCGTVTPISLEEVAASRQDFELAKLQLASMAATDSKQPDVSESKAAGMFVVAVLCGQLGAAQLYAPLKIRTVL